MKGYTKLMLVMVPMALLALPVQAHDPSEHMANAEKPNCESMKGMDHSSMNADDPVAQAMAMKCMQSAADDAMPAAEHPHAATAHEQEADDEHQHGEHQE